MDKLEDKVNHRPRRLRLSDRGVMKERGEESKVHRARVGARVAVIDRGEEIIILGRRVRGR